jgi:hypothetical protein
VVGVGLGVVGVGVGVGVGLGVVGLGLGVVGVGVGVVGVGLGVVGVGVGVVGLGLGVVGVGVGVVGVGLGVVGDALGVVGVGVGVVGRGLGFLGHGGGLVGHEARAVGHEVGVLVGRGVGLGRRWCCHRTGWLWSPCRLGINVHRAAALVVMLCGATIAVAPTMAAAAVVAARIVRGRDSLVIADRLSVRLLDSNETEKCPAHYRDSPSRPGRSLAHGRPSLGQVVFLRILRMSRVV